VHESLVHLWESSCRKYKERDVFGTRTPGGTWEWITYGQAGQLVDQARGGLAARGIQAGQRVALIADNSVPWAVVAHGTYSLGAVFVPMYTAQQPEEWQFILGDSNATLVVVATTKIYEELQSRRGQMPELKHIIGLDLPDDHVDSYAALLAKGKQQPCPPVYPKPEDVAGFIYTSGTTGNPKGVRLSHKNICSNCDAVREVFPLNRERSLAFLPWAHALGQTGELHFFTQEGFSIAINDDVGRLVTNLPEVQPTLLVAVPRIFNRIYDGVNRQMAAKPKVIQALFARGIQLAKQQSQGTNLGLLDQLTLRLADRLIFSKVRGRFGGRLKLTISGSAALNTKVAEFIDALGIMVYEGYGLTETSPVTSVNYPGARKMGSIGKPLPGVRVVIDESQSDNPGEGEIVIYGPHVMLGYHNRPEEDAKVFTSDGGFRSGDLGYLDSDGYLFITGRLKEQYKLETGKYVAPAALEEQLKLSPLVANAMLYGANKPHNVALVVLDPVALKDWCAQSGTALPTDPNKSPELVRAICDELNKCSQSFKSYERPTKVLLTTEDFTTENGLLTPSLKVRRNAVTKRYASALDALYEAPKGL
jgi:long-chain acyl-CoA synthetase